MKNTFTVVITLVLLTSTNMLHAQWTQSGGVYPNVGRLTVSGTNLFAATNIGIFLSTDMGATWTPADNGLTNFNVSDIAVYGTNLFAGTNSGLFLSTNNGANWVSAGFTNISINPITVLDTNIFVGTWGFGVFRSTDGGTTWTQVNNGLTDSLIYDFAISGTSLFVGTDGGMFLSSNYGDSWSPINTGLTDLKAVTPVVMGSDLFVGTWHGGVFASTNNGATWTPVDNGLPSTAMLGIHQLAVYGTNIFAGMEGGAFLSADSGKSWTSISTGMTNFEVTSFAFLGTKVFVGTMTGLGGMGSFVWSRPLSQIVTSVAGQSATSPTSYNLEQNYPNPFNPSTTIHYSLPSNAHVVLRLYDSLGREVKTLVDERQSAGQHSFTLDASGLASGAYFYQLQSDGKVFAKKLMIIK